MSACELSVRSLIHTNVIPGSIITILIPKIREVTILLFTNMTKLQLKYCIQFRWYN